VSDAQPGMTNKPNNNTIAINELHFFMRRFSKVGCMYGITFAGEYNGRRQFRKEKPSKKELA
jgi:hypothetical protein